MIDRTTGREEATDPLTIWYLEGESTFSTLAAGRDTVRSLAASSTVRMSDLGVLSAMVQGTEIWLLSHPSPEPLPGDYLQAVLDLLSSLGSHLFAFGGTLDDLEQRVLDDRAERAAAAVDDLTWMRTDWIARARRRGAI